jgi:integrase
MQRGTVIKRRASWTLLYYDLQFRDGKRKRVKVSKTLAKISKEFPSKASVRHLADKILSPINGKQLHPESSLTVSDYINDFYFPSVQKDLRPATIDSYKFSFGKLKGKLNIKLRDFRTVHVQRLLREINVGRRTLVHIKVFLSSVFKHAKQNGVLDGQNPVTDASVPGRPTKFKGVAYTFADVSALIEYLEEDENEEKLTLSQMSKHQTAIDVISVMSLSGLRTSECQGLRWSDWDEERQLLNIERSVWQSTIGPTKNAASENSIPVIPLLQKILQNRRERFQGKPGDYIFAGERRGAPLNFHNLEERVIKPRIKKAKRLKLEAGEWVPDDSTVVNWKGFHGFRRGLASNLFGMGINPKLIAAILRHGDVSSTLQWYIQTPDSETREAMQKLEAKYADMGLQAGEKVG